MDISDRYIELCRNAKEIQKHEATSGDWYADDCHGIHTLSISDFLPSKEPTHAEICEKEYIWLPRQDQLQDMIMPEYNIFGCDAIEHFMDDFHGFQEENNPLFSMEELTLAFVMDKIYNKQSSGSNWKYRGQKS